MRHWSIRVTYRRVTARGRGWETSNPQPKRGQAAVLARGRATAKHRDENWWMGTCSIDCCQNSSQEETFSFFFFFFFQDKEKEMSMKVTHRWKFNNFWEGSENTNLFPFCWWISGYALCSQGGWVPNHYTPSAAPIIWNHSLTSGWLLSQHMG